MNEFPPYRSTHPRLSAEGLLGREGLPYFPDPNLLAAANAALAVQMPLLLTGEAGCGKTDFAFAVASGLGKHPDAGKKTPRLLDAYVRSDSRARDLLYHYDAIRRFGDAQHGGTAGQQRAEDPRPYIRLQNLGKALLAPHLRVVLIDEIDKAPRDLPNDLLRELDQGSFEIPEIPAQDDDEAARVDVDDPATYRQQMRCPDPAKRPFVLITSNVERQLPDPFLRRCVFFHIRFPEEGELRKIVRSRCSGSESFLERVVDVFQALRETPTLTKKPATSELLNWVAVLRELHGEELMKGVLDRFAGGVDVRARSRRTELQWATLPHLGCLVKLREDLDRLGGN